jgi:hypothetical protein
MRKLPYICESWGFELFERPVASISDEKYTLAYFAQCVLLTTGEELHHPFNQLIGIYSSLYTQGGGCICRKEENV